MTKAKLSPKYKLLASQSWIESNDANVMDVDFWTTIRIYDNDGRLLVVEAPNSFIDYNNVHVGWLDLISNQYSRIRNKSAEDVEHIMEGLFLPKLTQEGRIKLDFNQDYYLHSKLHDFSINLIDASIGFSKGAPISEENCKRIKETEQYLIGHRRVFENYDNIPDIKTEASFGI